MKRQLFSFFFIYSAGGMSPEKIRVAQADVFIRFLEKKKKKKAFFLSVAIGNVLLVVAGGFKIGVAQADIFTWFLAKKK